jgi:uncharacterized protein
MSAALLDVNVLVAIAWPNHVHHSVARDWFLASRSGTWATCPLTESGFVRVSSNAKILPVPVSPAEAIELLFRLRTEPGHTFWADSVSIVGSAHVPRSRLVSHAQVTDAHLLALAREHGGRIATFDRGLVALAEPYGARDVELLLPLPTQLAP